MNRFNSHSALGALVPVLTVVASLWAAPADAAGSTVRIMPLGDSITRGCRGNCNSIDATDGGYRTNLYKMLTASGTSVDFVGSLASGPSSLPDKHHEGHSGARIDQLTASVAGWVATWQPDIVLLQAGTNDIFQNHDLARAPERLGALIDRIASTRPSAAIFVTTLTPLSWAEGTQAVDTFNAALPALVRARSAAGRNVTLINQRGAITADDLADGAHLKDTGYAKMADLWFRSINPANLLDNPGFERATLGPWWTVGGVTLGGDRHTGTSALRTGASQSGVGQTVSGLSPGTTYLMTAWGKVDVAGESVFVGVNSHGGPQQAVALTSTSFRQGIQTFTTGAGVTSATIYCWKESGQGAGHCDDFVLVPNAMNLADNPGFESGLTGWSAVGGAFASWQGHSGARALQTAASGSGVFQYVDGLTPNTTYLVSGWGRVSVSGESVSVGAKDYGGEASTAVRTTSYSKVFTRFTTGPTATGATLYCWKASGSGSSTCDDLQLQLLP